MKSNNEITSEKNKYATKILMLEKDINNLNNDLERFRTEYTQLNSSECFNC